MIIMVWQLLAYLAVMAAISMGIYKVIKSKDK